VLEKRAAQPLKVAVHHYYTKEIAMKTFAAVVAAVALVMVSFAVHGVTRGTPAEARAMLQKATDHYKSVGRKQALSDFTAGKPPFRDRDLYVVCVAADHTTAANGGFPTYVGTSVDVLVDAKGHQLGKALWDAATKNPEGSIEYPMINPATGKMESKTTFYSRVADDLLCGVGAYSAH
jgi:cytochrome c